MPSINTNSRLKEYQEFIRIVYGLPNDRHFNSNDMLANVERFIMRGLKGIRKNDQAKIKTNLVIALSWFTSLMNQLHIDIEKEIWERFPYLCSYCGNCPCSCKKEKLTERQMIVTDNKKRPKSLSGFQEMFEKIYPSKYRTVEHAGIHLAEEMGELSESFLAYQGNRDKSDLDKIRLEAADLFSCLMGIFNSIKIDLAAELSNIFSNNCHVCKKAPCECSFIEIVNFKS